jgi:non-specific serine/threonine protein kinase
VGQSAAVTAAGGVHGFPAALTSFIGRTGPVREVAGLLEQHRLVTVTGPGGVGKTRLAGEVARAVARRFGDGTWLAELAPVRNPAQVPGVVAAALGVREQPGVTAAEVLARVLARQQLLLVLDNCEHLLDVCAKLVNALLRQCPGVQILASSREALGIAGEQTYRVPSLSLPDRSQVQTPQTLSVYESVQLFIDRALLVRSDFAVTNRNAPALASLCCHLDGIPLAIELAAARVRSLSVEEIDGKLDQRFRLLTGGSRTALPRQQTLRSLIDWSYDLLQDPEKLLLRRLSVFAGGWTLEAAECVCAGGDVEGAAVLDLLTSLFDKSLVAVDQSDSRFRYRLLETVRQYARERLVESGGAEAIRERHRDYFVALAEEADNKLLGAEQADSLRLLEDEHDNLRSALEWSHVEAPAQPEAVRAPCA